MPTISKRHALAGISGLALMMAASVAHAQSPVVNATAQTQQIDCDGSDAAVNGSSNRLVFHGSCRSLRINGGDNIIEIDLVAGAPVTIAGSGNHVLYSPNGGAAAPVVVANGNGNEVSVNDQPATVALGGTLPTEAPKSPTLLMAPAGPQAGALILDGDRQAQTQDCNGRDVIIHGSSSQFTLTGGCRSITVQGRADQIQAQLQPGARIAIGGDTVTLNYTLTNPGPAPILSVTGNGSTATHVQNFQNTEIKVPAGAPVIVTPPAR